MIAMEDTERTVRDTFRSMLKVNGGDVSSATILTLCVVAKDLPGVFSDAFAKGVQYGLFGQASGGSIEVVASQLECMAEHFRDGMDNLPELAALLKGRIESGGSGAHEYDLEDS